MYMNEETKASLEGLLGKPLREISEMDFDQELRFVEERTNKLPVFSKRADSRMSGRGNPLITRRKIATLQDVDRRLRELK